MLDLDSYLAGLFDGEGYISAQHRQNYNKHRAYTRLAVGVGMTHRPTVELFHKRFGGAIYTGKQKLSVNHQWSLTGSNTIPALEVLSQLCILKRPELECALELAAMLRKGRAKGRRVKGSWVVTQEEEVRRVELARRITELKGHSRSCELPRVPAILVVNDA